VRRPSIRPKPVTTPSPTIFLSVHAEVGAVVGDEAVELGERARVEQRVHALARGAFALLVLVGHALGAAAEARGLRHRGEAGELVSAVHRTSVGPHG
jgi:hypothetical protein